ncbi:MAG: hypothetical protein ACJ79R_08795 [Anaeromyxobacteraceae bacterium]
MPDKLSHQWWSPVLPVSFFLSSIPAGTALIIVHEMWIAAMWDRRVRSAQLAASILLFGLGARLLPVLPEDEAAHEA